MTCVASRCLARLRLPSHLGRYWSSSEPRSLPPSPFHYALLNQLPVARRDQRLSLSLGGSLGDWQGGKSREENLSQRRACTIGLAVVIPRREMERSCSQGDPCAPHQPPMGRTLKHRRFALVCRPIRQIAQARTCTRETTPCKPIDGHTLMLKTSHFPSLGDRIPGSSHLDRQLGATYPGGPEACRPGACVELWKEWLRGSGPAFPNFICLFQFQLTRTEEFCNFTVPFGPVLVLNPKRQFYGVLW